MLFADDGFPSLLPEPVLPSSTTTAEDTLTGSGSGIGAGRGGSWPLCLFVCIDKRADERLVFSVGLSGSKSPNPGRDGAEGRARPAMKNNEKRGERERNYLI